MRLFVGAVPGLLAVPVVLAGSGGLDVGAHASGLAYGCFGTTVVSHHCCPSTQMLFSVLAACIPLCSCCSLGGDALPGLWQ